jgi:VWFA-related protein
MGALQASRGRLLAAWVLTLTAVAAARADDPVLWPEHQRAFFQDGPALLLDAAARRELTALGPGARDRFIADFLRDPIPETPDNELVTGIERRSRLVRDAVPTPLDDRARLLFLHGAPAGREEIDCGTALVPIVIWSYSGLGEFVLYQPPGRQVYRLWRPNDGKRALYSSLMEGWFDELEDAGQEHSRIDIQVCRGVARVDAVTRTVGLVDEQPDVELARAVEALLAPPEDLAVWSRAAAATPLPDPPPPLDLQGVEVQFPFRSGQRVAVRFTAALDADGLERAADDGDLELEVEGLLEQEGEVFEDFKVRFERAAAAAGEPVVLVWERRLRPGRDFVARVRVRDTIGGATAHWVRVVSVPSDVERAVAGGAGHSVPVEEVAASPMAGEDSLVLVPPVTDGLSKAWRAEALVTGERIRRVIFAVDGEDQLIRTRPPYTADLRLSAVPTEQVVTATGFDADGAVVARDRVVLNEARGLFRVRIVAPREGEAASGRLTARAEVSVPTEARLQGVEFAIDEKAVARLEHPPWEVAIDAADTTDVSYLTVTATLADGTRAEDVVFLRAPRNLGRIDVGLVELFATVTDGSGRLVDDLTSDQFEVLESGGERSIERFDLVHNLPLVVGFAMDVSTSMGDHLAEARQAAIGFLGSVLRPGDRAFAVAFSDRAELVASPTQDVSVVEKALESVHSSGWTTLYDAVVKSLFYFRGFGGRRALVVLSDGDDTSSRTSFAETLEYARRSGAVIYCVAIGGGARGKLKRLSDETGGRYFQVRRAEELDAVYDEIERELRSQYFLTFAPADIDVDLAQVEVRVRDRHLNVRATRGYAP